jgi:hypothetical protein
MTRSDLVRALRQRGLAAMAVLSLIVLMTAPSAPPAGSASSPDPGATPLPASTPTAQAPAPQPSGDPARADGWAIQSERCGAGRWAVKSLGDGEVSRLDLASIVTARVADLAAVRRPLTGLPRDGRLGPLETTVFAVTARLVEARRTELGEIQLVIGDQDGVARTLLVIPAEECLVRTPAALRKRIGAAAEQVVGACGPQAEAWASMSGEVRVVAAAYWAPAGQVGPAGNGLWLSAPLAFEALGPCTASGEPARQGTAPVVNGQ